MKHRTMKRCVAAVAAGLAAGAVAKEVAHLGVGIAPIDPMVGRHLGLGEGAGLAVVHVDERGAAKGKVEEGDILFKFNDQILVTPEQLAVLVRREKPGAKAELTVYHDGRASKIEVTLGSRDDRELPPLQPQTRGQPWGPMFRQWEPDNWPDIREWIDQMRRRMPRGFDRAWRSETDDELDADNEPETAEPASPGKSRPGVELHTSSSAVISETRDDVNITFKIQDGVRSAKITKGGQVVFDGPANNEKELKQIPEEYRERLEELQKRVRINFPQSPAAPARTARPPRGNVL